MGFVKIILFLFLIGFGTKGSCQQIAIDRVEKMPNLPKPYKMRDWKKVALIFDQLAFDFRRKGKYLPLLKWYNCKTNTGEKGFFLPSYVGPKVPGGEGITAMASLVGATFAGIDKSRGKYNWVKMAEKFYNKDNGENLVLNSPNTSSGQSFWYEVFPHILFYTLSARYSKIASMARIMKITADRWYQACYLLRGNFHYTAFNFKKGKGVYNGKWREPDSAAGIGWLQYVAWHRFKNPKYLRAAKWCMQALMNYKKNPYYEVQLPFGAYTAARMNAELGTRYDVAKIINWCFDRSDARVDMAVIADRWADYDCHGLVGSVNRPPYRKEGGGYAFTMNTFAFAWPMVPLVRYDDRFARAIGKWILNAGNAARLFYANAHPADRQSCPNWKGDPHSVIAYEGLRHHWHKGEAFFAGGDPCYYKWPFETDFAIYGSAFVGVFGGIVKTTNVKYILQIDCLATDSFYTRAYPTYLYFNPYKEAKVIAIDVGKSPQALYDAVSNKIIAENIQGITKFSILANTAILLVVIPANGKWSQKGNKKLVNDVIVDYR